MKFFLLFVSLFFVSCSIKNYEFTQSKIIIIKSPKLKFADLGFIRHSDTSVQIELFVAGKSVKKIDIHHLICVDEGCMSKSGFNAEYLNENYPSDLLQNIVLGKEIYNGKNKEKTKNGFMQTIKTNSVDISYTVQENEIFFKDRYNKILFKIKDINE